MKRYSNSIVLSPNQKYPAFALSEVSPRFLPFSLQIAYLSVPNQTVRDGRRTRYNGRGIHWVVCGHRKRRGLEARRKDMSPQHIQKAENEILYWERYFNGPTLAREREEREIKRQALLQSETLGETHRASSTGHKSDKGQ